MKIWNWIGKLGLLTVLGLAGGMLGQVFTGMIPAGVGQGVVIPQVSAQSGATLSGIYATYGGNVWGPIFPGKVPPVTSMWTMGGRAALLTDITGGGLSFNSGATQSPGGFFVSTLSTTAWTFTVQMSGLTSDTNGVIGIYCADNAGNGALFHGGLSATSVSHWTGMQNGGSPAYQASLANSPAWAVVPQFWQIQVTAGARNYNYSTDGQNWTAYSNEGSTAFVTCTKVGIEGYGDGTNFGSLATIVSVSNTTP
jgi:hypothetical protein